ncbi:hypothetical protein FSP39_014354 [Pinctada imbricata]|uniref:XK-related protein n=1 Tax=Pinctada imbricata TaxID=66713 RepID=A0AA88XS02_PINIB|nr:hypothetical protein FSP39_014354 [Pinctada imbricata]
MLMIRRKKLKKPMILKRKVSQSITEADKLLNNDIASKTGNDVVEPKASKTWPPKFHIYDLLLAIVSFFTFAVDYGTDVILIVEYYINSEIVLFIISLCFIALPSIVSGIISAIWHRAAYVENNKKFKDDEKDDTKEREWKKKHQRKSKKSYIMMTLLSFVQLGRLARQFQYLILIGNSIRLKRQISKTENKQERAELERKDRNLRNRAISEKRDTAMLGLIDGFLESALQLVLQLYLAMLLSLPFHPLRVGSLIASLVSTSLIHTSYYRTNRRATQKKESVSYFSAIFYFLMRMSELGPRYLLLAMFCVVFRPWSFIAIPVHMLFVLVLYKSEKPSLEGICPTESGPCLLKSLQHLFVFMMSYLGLFSFVNLFEGKTRRPAAIFYSVFYVENIVMTCLLLWYLVTYNMYVGWVYVLWAMPIGLVCHAISGTLFYEVFHPNIWNARFPNFCKCSPPCCKEISED